MTATPSSPQEFYTILIEQIAADTPSFEPLLSALREHPEWLHEPIAWSRAAVPFFPQEGRGNTSVFRLLSFFLFRQKVVISSPTEEIQRLYTFIQSCYADLIIANAFQKEALLDLSEKPGQSVLHRLSLALQTADGIDPSTEQYYKNIHQEILTLYLDCIASLKPSEIQALLNDRDETGKTALQTVEWLGTSYTHEPLLIKVIALKDASQAPPIQNPVTTDPIPPIQNPVTINPPAPAATPLTTDQPSAAPEPIKTAPAPATATPAPQKRAASKKSLAATPLSVSTPAAQASSWVWPLCSTLLGGIIGILLSFVLPALGAFYPMLIASAALSAVLGFCIHKICFTQAPEPVSHPSPPDSAAPSASSEHSSIEHEELKKSPSAILVHQQAQTGLATESPSGPQPSPTPPSPSPH